MHLKRVVVSLAMSAVAAVSGRINSSNGSDGGARSPVAFVGASTAVASAETFRARNAGRYGIRSRPAAIAFASRKQQNPLAPMYSDGVPANRALFVSGGAAAVPPAVGTSSAGGVTAPSSGSGGVQSGFGLGSAWGVLSVVFILMNAVKRLTPIALQPFSRGDFTTAQWAMYGGFAAIMAYAEGFKGFQKKFSPLVVKRALTLDAPTTKAGPLRLLFAGPFSMGLFHATKKRRTISWGLTTGVMCLVQLVKKLPYPWRSIVDAGVVVGLSYGMLSICFIWARALMGKAPAIDPAMPEAKP